MKKHIVIFLLLGGFLVCQSGSKVKLVNDGDTFELGNGQKVRLLGIDTPESYQLGGNSAKDFLEELVLGKEVRLEKDQTDKDKYRRLLRYVYVGTLFVNAEIIRQGYAEVQFFPPDTLYRRNFEALEEMAYRNKKGLWALLALQAPFIEVTKVKEVISWEEAGKYYWKVKTVEGIIVDTRNSGKKCFLNFRPNWRRYFTAVISAGDFHKFPPHPEDYYRNKKVWVTGLIKQYRGEYKEKLYTKPEIILRSPSQIEIVE